MRSTALALILFAAAAAAAQTYDPCVAPRVCEELKKVGEIASSGGTLQGVIDLKIENRSIIDYDTRSIDLKLKYPARDHILRAYQGYQGFVNPSRGKSVLPSGAAFPGPTLRARVGEEVRLIFLNRIDPSQFPATSVTSSRDQCDQSSGETGLTYPGPNEKFPNCFHASNTSNLHFHGTHVSPGKFGDNVLIGVLPNKSLNVDEAIAESWKLFDGGSEADFVSGAMKALVKMRDDAKAKGDTQLAAQLDSAVEANQRNVAAGEWPQYWPGFYPYHFTLPVASGTNRFPVMGQAPGTHWYHAHQHGSTTAQSLNGMSGVFVVTGDYDDKILALGGGTPKKPKIAEKVMIFQLFQEQPNLIFNTNAPATNRKTITAVNGQVLPTVTMKKGEVQWWRIANAAVKANGMDQYLFISNDVYQPRALDTTSAKTKGVPPPSKKGSVPRIYQTAQDGVQFDWQNYQSRLKPVFTGDDELTTFPMAPGNRVDLLVQAPATEGISYLLFWPAKSVTGGFTDINRNLVLRVVVKGEPTDVNTSLPDASTYPKLPDDLANIDPATVRVRRTVEFSMSKGPNTTNPDPNDTRLDPPQFFIDGKQFSEGIIDQVMLLGNAEEWTITNTSTSGVSHPFHIHVNPFQIVEVFDPDTNTKTTGTGPLVWGDTISIPAGVADATGQVTPGYVKIRTRFVDFPGKFVLHCHILGHEDRGMMQLVQVLDNKTVVKHH